MAGRMTAAISAKNAAVVALIRASFREAGRRMSRVRSPLVREDRIERERELRRVLAGPGCAVRQPEYAFPAAHACSVEDPFERAGFLVRQVGEHQMGNVPMRFVYVPGVFSCARSRASAVGGSKAKMRSSPSPLFPSRQTEYPDGTYAVILGFPRARREPGFRIREPRVQPD